MAQVEDTELRDLVIEALEKNGSLAKIRALLRANIFLAFEDEYENVKQNINLDNVLNIPEGILALSIVHEFLESCNLKNTLFVYKTESRQGKDYNYEEKKVLADKLCLNKEENIKEPVLVTLIKNITNALRNKGQYDQNDKSYEKKDSDCLYNEQNSSYIVHDDSQSSTTNTSQSDNSMDEKNKLHLRIQLGNSDTDTSDSSRGKSASEYMPNSVAIQTDRSNKSNNEIQPLHNEKNITKRDENLPYFLKTTNNSSDSTSYVDLKPFSLFDEKMLNTTGLPHDVVIGKSSQILTSQNEVISKRDSDKSATSNSISSISMKNDSNKTDPEKLELKLSSKSDGDTADYSNDFTISQMSKHKNETDNPLSPNSSGDNKNDMNKMVNSPIVSPHLNSHSSISISDVADLISEKSSSIEHSNEKSLEADNKSKSPLSNHSKKRSEKSSRIYSDDSGDFTESPIPSLSNLSLGIHSD